MKHSHKLFVAFSIFTAITLSSCQLFYPTDPIPAYIHIDKINLLVSDTTTTGEGTLGGSGQGSRSCKISDAWVYVDEQLVGCFELPVTFPVLSEGNHLVRIRAGIKVNGIAATRAPYPFYEDFTQYVNFQQGKRITLTPTVKYRTNITFGFIENFDGAGTTLTLSPAITDTTGAVRLQIINRATNPNVFEGPNSAMAHLDATHYEFECITNTSYTLPQAGAPIFLEFNYKCNAPFTIGIYAHALSGTTKASALSFNPSADWNKAYLYLTPVVDGASNATDYNLFIGMVNYTFADSLALVLDNLKLVY
jgi:hypothetical protein